MKREGWARGRRRGKEKNISTEMYGSHVELDTRCIIKKLIIDG